MSSYRVDIRRGRTSGSATGRTPDSATMGGPGRRRSYTSEKKNEKKDHPGEAEELISRRRHTYVLETEQTPNENH